MRYICRSTNRGSDKVNIYLVYKKYNKEFIAYAKSITKNSGRAFDLVQEAYVSALERERMFANMNEHQIKGWFFTTIKNKNIDIPITNFLFLSNGLNIVLNIFTPPDLILFLGQLVHI